MTQANKLKSLSATLLRTIAWMAKAAALVVVTLLLLVGVLFFAMWREHRTAVQLPNPTGHFAVGRTTYAWTNESEIDEFSPSGAKRRVMAWVWYPATRSERDVPAEYLPGPWRVALAQRLGLFLGSFFKRDPALVRTHSAVDAMVSGEKASYPVVLLRPGGNAPTTDFTTLAEDLASHGFFVVGFDAPYRSLVFVLPDGSVVTRAPGANVENANSNLADPLIGKLLAMWTSDTKFVVDQLQRLNEGSLDRFAGRMDLRRLGMFGHSFGGATALEFCHEDTRCKAALDMDGIPFGRVVTEGLGKPGMFLLSDHSGEMADPESHQVLAEIRSIYDRLPETRLYAVIRQTNHFSFSDQILLNSQVAMQLIFRLGRAGRLDGRRGLAISADYVQAFFEVTLNGGRPALLTSLAAKYSEVEIATGRGN